MSLENQIGIDNTDDQSSGYLRHVRQGEAADNLAWACKQYGFDAQAGANPTVPPEVSPDATGTQGSRLSRVGRNIADIPLSLGYGAIRGANQAIQTIYDLAGGVRQYAPDWLDYGLNVDFRGEGILPEISVYQGKPEAPVQMPQFFNPPDTGTGEVAASIAQFLSGYAAGGQVLKPLKAVGSAASFAKAAAQGAISDFAFFGAQEDRLSNLVQSVPALQNPISEFLAAEEDDGQIEGRLKNAVEGLGLGVATEGVSKALGSVVRAVRQARAARAAAESEGPDAAEAVFRGMNEAADPEARTFSALGEVDAPMLTEAERPAATSPAASAAPAPQFRETDADSFIALRNRSDRPEFLTPYTAEEMKGWRHFVTDDGVGFTLTDKNDIIGVVNNSGVRGAGAEAVIEAIGRGGRTLDAIGWHLARYYKRFGFVETQRIPWDDQYAPKGWNYEQYGRPDVVFFEYPEGLSRDRGDVRRRFEAARGGEPGRGSVGSGSGGGEFSGSAREIQPGMVQREQLLVDPRTETLEQHVSPEGLRSESGPEDAWQILAGRRTGDPLNAEQSLVASVAPAPQFRETDADSFIVLRNRSDRPEFLTPYTAEEMKGWRHFVTDDGVGFTLTDKNDIIGVVNNSGVRGAGAEAVIEAIGRGGRTLDAIGGHLARYYKRFGFVETQRIPWDDQHAPEGWNYEQYDRPDVVFFEYPEGLSRDRGDVRRRFEAARGGEPGRGSVGSGSGGGEHQGIDRGIRGGMGMEASDTPEGSIGISEHNVSPEGSSSPTELRSESGPKEFYINFARIDTQDDVKTVIQNMADAYRPDIEAARRGVRSFQQTSLSAEQEDAWQILAGRRTGDPLNAEQSLAARNLWASSGQKLSELAKLATQTPTEENLFAFGKMLEVHRSVQNEVVAARTESARALASWRIPTGPKELQLRQITDLLDAQPGGSETIRDMAAKVAAMSDAGMVRQLDTLVEKAPFAIAKGMVQEYWIMALLSNVKTHVVNTVSNSFVAMQQVFERGAAARIGRALGDDTGVQLGEGLALLHGGVGAIRDGLRLAGKAFGENQGGAWAGKAEVPPTPAISAENMRLDRDSAFGKAVDVIGNVIRIPGRALMAEDEFFKTIGYRAELNALAFRQATREAESGRITRDQVRQRIADILENPPDDLNIAAVDHAAYSTFTDAPGKVAQTWLKLCRDTPSLRYITPFIKTPARIFNYAVAERSPFAPLFRSFRADVAAGGARRQLALARVSTGTTMMLAAADLAFSGVITGGGPPNPAERQTLTRIGWQPYSVKLGDRYFSYARTDPLGMTFGIAADMSEIVNNMDHNDQEVDPEDAATFFAASIAGNMMSKSYMSGLSGLMDALGDPERYSENFVNRFAGSFIPAGMGEAARATDPYMLEVGSMVDAMKARIPGLSSSLPARRDLWGRAISYRSGLGVLYDALSPIASRREHPEPIDNEMLRQELFISAPGRKVVFDGVTVDLSRFGDAASRYAQLAGDEAKHPAWNKGALALLNETVQGQGPLAGRYNMLSDGPEGGKAEFIRAAISEYRELARRQLLREYPELRDYVNAKQAELPGKYNF